MLLGLAALGLTGDVREATIGTYEIRQTDLDLRARERQLSA